MRLQKINSLIFLGVLVSILLCGCSQIKSPRISPKEELHKVELQLTPTKYKIEKLTDENYQSIEMEGFSSISSEGKPMMPFKVIEVLLPEKVILNSVKLKITDLETIQLPGKYLLKPAPMAHHDLNHYTKDLFDLFPKDYGYIDKEIYNKNSFFPEAPIKLIPTTTKGTIAGHLMNFSRIIYTPFQYNPISKKLRLIEYANLTLTYETDGIVSKLPIEFEMSDNHYNYVIITTNRIKAGSQQLSEFVDFKKRQGYSVIVITESDFGQTSGPFPNGRAEKIRQWLVENWQPMGIEYVLLIGNPEPDDPMYSHDIGDEKNDPNYDQDCYIPMKQIWHALPGRGKAVSPYFQSNAPLPHWGDATDWYYADLTGNWDADGDGFYGESPWLSQNDIEVSALPNGIDANSFSVRWTKKITVSHPRETTLYLKQWEGARLLIDKQVILDHWPHTLRKSDVSTNVHLGSGVHEIIVEYYQNTGHGHIFAFMDGTVLDGFSGEYYNNTMLQGKPIATINHDTLWKNWETSDFTKNDTTNEFGLTGGVDLSAEVSVGRIPVYNNDYATLDKILRRVSSGIAREGQRKILLPMKTMDNSTPSYDLGEAILNDIVDVEPFSFSAYRIYDENYNLTSVPEITPCSSGNVVDAWNMGFGMVTWMTHGTWRYANSVLDVKYQLPQLEEWFRPIVFEASCHNGNIYLPDCYPNCSSDLNDLEFTADGRISLGYSLLRDVASATISASEISTYISGSFVSNPLSLDNANFAYLYTKEVVSNHSSTGDALKNVKYTHFNNPNVAQYLNYHQQLIYNLYGDPSLYLRAQYGIQPIEPEEAEEAPDIVLRDFIPRICLYVVDCPGCIRTGLCDYVFFTIGPFTEPFTVEVLNQSGEVVAKSPNGINHKIQFEYDTKYKYSLVLKPAERKGFRKRMKGLLPTISFKK